MKESVGIMLCITVTVLCSIFGYAVIAFIAVYKIFKEHKKKEGE